MPEHIYALLIGIAEYPDAIPPVPRLEGPLNDIEMMKTFLRERLDGSETKLKLHTLCNQEATRQAIVTAWQEHLGQAGQEDIALFMFCGHGSRISVQAQPNASEVYQETLVCWDSRLDRGSDLRDTEIAGLIKELSATCPHLILLFDCCHAGSVHRTPRPPRLAPPDPRALATPWQSATTVSALQDPPVLSPFRTRSFHHEDNLQVDTAGGYVMLAACQAQELAQEGREGRDGQVHGVFSAALLEALRQTPGDITYGDLYQRVVARVRARTRIQTPRFESSLLDGMQRLFLGNSLRPRPVTFRIAFDRDHDWMLEAGLLQGVPLEGAGKARMALFAQDCTEEQIYHRERVQATATLAAVLPHYSLITPDAEETLDQSATYKAVFTDLPHAALRVSLAGQPAGIDALRSALEHARRLTQWMPIQEVQSQAEADVSVLAETSSYVLQTPEEVPLCHIPGSHAEADRQVLERLERIQNWRHLARLTNETSSSLPSGAVTMELFPAESARYRSDARDPGTKAAGSASEPLELRYWLAGGRWQKPSLTVRLTNHTPMRLYVALLGLSENYAIENILQGGCIPLPAQQSSEHTIGTEVPNELWRQGIARTTDILKLLVCREWFEAYALEQIPITIPLKTTQGLQSAQGETEFPRVRRNLSKDDRKVTGSDWLVLEACVTTVRPLPSSLSDRNG